MNVTKSDRCWHRMRGWPCLALFRALWRPGEAPTLLKNAIGPTYGMSRTRCTFVLYLWTMLDIWLLFVLSSTSHVSSHALELSSNSGWLLVRNWFICIEHLPCFVRFQCMLGGRSVEVWAKNFLCWFIKGQTHFGMLRGAKMDLALDEPK